MVSARRPSHWRPPRCPEGKVAYRTQGRALYALKVFQREDAQAVINLPMELRGVRRCKSCGAWHLSTREGVSK